MSEDSDKTQIKFSKGIGNAESGDSNVVDDKTRISSPNDESSQAADERKKNAEKKARELEKRLAAISASKKKQELGDSAKDESDKTRIEFDRAGSSEVGSDKTVIKKTSLPDETVIKSAVSHEVHSLSSDLEDQELDQSASDKTQFSPKFQPVASMPISARSDQTGPDDTTLVTTPEALESEGSVVSTPEASHNEDDAGTLKGRFVYEEVLGAGGMGVVYKAKDLLKVEAQDRDPYVAIKVLGDEFKTHPEAFIALQRESRKTQRIAHPNIVNVHDFDRDGDTVFMTMEFLDGKPLDKLISQYKSTGLPDEDAWKILEGISSALIYAHEQKIIHSDFKPGNIFVTKQGLAKVFDFGIARAVAKAEKFEESADDKTVFDAGNLGALTPAYASLEMLEGQAPDVRDDIYALGCIAYEVFTGNHPFNRVHANEAMRKKMKPKRISTISKRQWRVIEKALAFKRDDRIASVAEFWQQITSKAGSAVWVTAAVSLLIALIGGMAYQIYFAPEPEGFSEDEIRSEIEREVLIDQNKSTIEALLQSLIFDKNWEKRVYDAYDVLSKLLPEDDVWLVQLRQNIHRAYLNEVKRLIQVESFVRAREVLENFPRYGAEQDLIAQLLNDITEGESRLQLRLAEEEKQKQVAAQRQRANVQKAEVEKQKNQDFDIAMNTLNEQLLCRSTMNMGDIDIAISKLRSLNSSRYPEAEAEIIAKLSACISKIGQSFPDRAEEFKKRAIRIFPNSGTVANIKIEPKDPCDVALAGLGARGNRAICRDSLKDDTKDLGKGPALVVIPAKGSLNTFAIGKYEVTVEDMNRFCENSNACTPGEKSQAKYPKTNVSADTVKKYLRWLSETSKRRYRLPSKSEWTYAARANSGKVDSNRNCRLDSRGIKKGGVISRASTGQQNPWGLVNHLGNARELVGKSGGFLAMGGSYDTVIEECVVTKAEAHSGNADVTTGFRVLREID